MKKITLSRLTMLVSTGIFLFALSSCSTSQMALDLHRNHIILVKAPPTNSADPQKAVATTATASADASLLALPEKNPMIDANSFGDLQISRHAPLIPVDNLTVAKTSATKTNLAPMLSYDAKTKAIIKTIEFVQKISGKKQESAAPGSVGMDSHKLLILWIACFAGAILLSIVFAAAGGLGGLWIISYLLWLAGIVFFILWLLSVLNG